MEVTDSVTTRTKAKTNLKKSIAGAYHTAIAAAPVGSRVRTSRYPTGGHVVPEGARKRRMLRAPEVSSLDMFRSSGLDTD